MIEILLKVASNTITLNGIHETERRTYFKATPVQTRTNSERAKALTRRALKNRRRDQQTFRS